VTTCRARKNPCLLIHGKRILVVCSHWGGKIGV
jgi:hypothetical protein